MTQNIDPDAEDFEPTWKLKASFRPAGERVEVFPIYAVGNEPVIIIKPEPETNEDGSHAVRFDVESVDFEDAETLAEVLEIVVAGLRQHVFAEGL